MKALQENTDSVHSFVLVDNEKNTLSESSKNRTKQQIVEHIDNGVDIIVVTSTQREAESSFLDKFFKNSDDEIRTIFLNSDFFPKGNISESGAGIDLSMISAVVYESIHLDDHFAIVITDADKLSINVLDEIVKLALGINSNKNNVSFIFAGDPALINVIERVTNIGNLSLAHCSLDHLSVDDIEDFINQKQLGVSDVEKLRFNKFALKKITAQAGGSLYKASVLLEWCRTYALYTNNIKVTSGSIDDLSNNLLRLSRQDGVTHASSYPPSGFKFSDSSSVVIGSKSENIEFTRNKPTARKKHSDKKVNTESGQENSKTIYVEKKDSKNIPAANVYERVMTAPSEDTANIDNVEEEPIEDIALQEEPAVIEDTANIDNVEEEPIEDIALQEEPAVIEDTANIEKVEEEPIEDIVLQEEPAVIEDTANIENVEEEPIEDIAPQEEPAVIEDTANIENVEEKFIEEITLQEEPAVIEDTANIENVEEEFIEEITLQEPCLNKNEADYQDTYRIEALDKLNEPLDFKPTSDIGTSSSTFSPSKPHTNASKQKNLTTVLLLILAISILIACYYYLNTHKLSKEQASSFFDSITNEITNFYDSNFAKDSAKLDSTSIATDPQPILIDDSQNGLAIQALLDLAQEQIQEKKLSTPPSDNALDTYRMVLQFDAENDEALSGIKMIKDRYVFWAKQDIKNNNSTRAKYFLQLAIEISPDDHESTQLLSNLN